MQLRVFEEASGYTISGVRCGTPFQASYGYDGSSSVSWGDFIPAMSEVNYSNIAPIYEFSWSLDSLTITRFYRVIKSVGEETLRFKNKDAFKDLINSILKSGNCENKLNAILIEIGELAGDGQSLRSSTVSELFELPMNQKNGTLGFESTEREAYDLYKSINNMTDEIASSNWWHPKVDNKCSIGRVLQSESSRR